MKQTLKTLSLGLVAGFGGAYLFSATPLSNPNPSEEAPAALQYNAEDATKEQPELVKNQAPTREYQNQALPSFSLAAKSSLSSVVYIKTLSKKEYRRQTWSDLFFGRTPNRTIEKRVAGSGSGVIFSEDGYIVTNNHVIEGADEIQVVHKKETYIATLVGTDPSTDLALLKVEAKSLPSIEIGTAKTLDVGEWVLAVGNPFNLTSTVTAGIVSAKGRKIGILDDLFPIESFIQTDAAINPGNSGGALVNKDGELVGINTAILSQTGSYAGYGFAVPVDIAVKIINDLRKYGEVQKAFIGADVMEVTAEVASRLKLPNYNGVLLTRIEESGAAAQVGLTRGDVIISIDGEPIEGETQYAEYMSYYRPGDQLKVEYLRDGKKFTTTITLTNIEGTTGIIKREVFKNEALGASFEIVPKVERERLGIESGIRITQVESGLMKRMGLAKDFIIIGVNNYRIENPEELSKILQQVRGRVVLQGIDAEGEYRYFSYIF